MYALSVLIWEYCFLCAGCGFYVTLLYTPLRAVSFAPMLMTAFAMYFSVSYCCLLIKESFENVGQSLYMSKWYLMNVHHRKDFLKILMLGHKQKTLRVGAFGFASLERFTQV